jgi:hypothetical protein
MRRLQHFGERPAHHHLATEPAHRLDLEVLELLRDPPRRQIV